MTDLGKKIKAVLTRTMFRSEGQLFILITVCHPQHCGITRKSQFVDYLRVT